jgi:hypothetical protein
LPKNAQTADVDRGREVSAGSLPISKLNSRATASPSPTVSKASRSAPVASTSFTSRRSLSLGLCEFLPHILYRHQRISRRTMLATRRSLTSPRLGGFSLIWIGSLPMASAGLHRWPRFVINNGLVAARVAGPKGAKRYDLCGSLVRLARGRRDTPCHTRDLPGQTRMA